MAGSDHQKSWVVVAEELLAMARIDTAFADLYLQRARELVSPEPTERRDPALRELDEKVAALTSRIDTAVGERDWARVRELTRRATDLTRALPESARNQAVAARIQVFDEVLVDPFSPGTSELASVPARELPALRAAALECLEQLRLEDRAWSELYQARAKALAKARFTTYSAAVAALEERAQWALARGNLAQLHQLSSEIAERTSEAPAEDEAVTRAAPPAPELENPFSREVCERAARLALAPHRVESIADEMRAKLKPGWRISRGDRSGNTVHFAMTIPGDAGEPLRESLALFMNRAFLTSAGTRFVPWCVAEDVLVEDFDEAKAGAAAATSPLLGALGLPRRDALARTDIEKALRARGAAVVRDLGLDPREHRIVCIPSDVYMRLGAKLGWGKRELWTHFDGYMVSEHRKLMPLVGGDARFGGLHDLVAVSGSYTSDRLFARFAIVQRRRFATW